MIVSDIMTDTLLTILQTSGVAVAMLFCIGFAVWRLFGWIGKRMDDWVLPVVKKHMEFITTLEARLIEMHSQQEKQTVALISHAEALTVQSNAMQKQAEAMEKMISRLERLESKE
jgi:uncharacterized coiled-coil protein SlyX